MGKDDLGWNSFFEAQFQQYSTGDYVALRITRENREMYVAYGEDGEFHCEITGKFRFEHTRKSQFPAVGDWVVVTINAHEKKAMIHGVLPRKSSFSRKVAGEATEEQTVAANIDTIFIVVGLDSNFNARRIERYLAIAWESGAVPVLLLNKADLCPESEQRKLEVEAIAIGVEVILLSAQSHTNIDVLRKYIQVGKTIAFLGSSGVGKSTLINALLGTHRQATKEVSSLGSRGRHTTTYRELIFMPGGGMVIDTPGMREMQVWGDEDGLEQTFADIAELATHCRFKDCTHMNEPGCAVLTAMTNGELDAKRLAGYLKLKDEFAYLYARQTMKASAIEKARWKTISKYAKTLNKDH